MSDVQQALDDLYLLVTWAEIGLRQDVEVIGGKKPDLAALNRRMRAIILTHEFRDVEGRPDPNQTDLFKQNQGENDVQS
jgi:hypothetical protein